MRTRIRQPTDKISKDNINTNVPVPTNRQRASREHARRGYIAEAPVPLGVQSAVSQGGAEEGEEAGNVHIYTTHIELDLGLFR